ncbi:uncharacterized protein C9orf85 homolog isoform X1 [Anser cygnoides]|uniref:uncharacterized protein C9orf85 homolog isoform X1 n=1 Tax=Anser cygnoides TaxID=8845 RepID=UPI0034D207A1
MSSERGNAVRRRPQRHQNVRAFSNQRHDASRLRKVGHRGGTGQAAGGRAATRPRPGRGAPWGGPERINAKLHDGVCQHCKDILEWRVKFNKYKLLSKPKKCVKCLQKAVKDPYHIICRPCACKLEICAKCGKEEEIVIPIDKGQDRTESKTTENGQENGSEDEPDSDTNFSSTDNEEDADVLEERFKNMNFKRTEV